MACPKCETPPELLHGPLALRMWMELGHSAGKLRDIARGLGMTAEREPDTGALRVGTDAAALRGAVDGFLEGMSQIERRATRVIVSAAEARPGLRDVKRLLTLDQLIARLRGDWLLEALRARAIDVAFDPIAHADDPRELYAREARLSLRDSGGAPRAAEEAFALAEDADVLAVLDREARLASIRAAGAAGGGLPTVVGFSPSAIYDPRYCLRTTVAAAEAEGVAREEVIFSILPAAAGADLAHLENILGYYVENGFRTALTVSATGQASFEMLRRLKPSLVFVDASIAAGVARDGFKEVIARKILEIAQKLQIETVVSGCVDAADAQWAYSQGASYVQGPHVAEVAGPALAEAS